MISPDFVAATAIAQAAADAAVQMKALADVILGPDSTATHENTARQLQHLAEALEKAVVEVQNAAPPPPPRRTPPPTGRTPPV